MASQSRSVSFLFHLVPVSEQCLGLSSPFCMPLVCALLKGFSVLSKAWGKEVGKQPRTTYLKRGASLQLQTALVQVQVRPPAIHCLIVSTSFWLRPRTGLALWPPFFLQD